MLDVNKLKNDFPIFQRKIDGKELVYLDSAASSQKPKYVIDAEYDFYKNHYANIHRGLYVLSEEATEMYEKAREKVAGFINCSPNLIVFTKNTTESINLVAYSWGLNNLTKNSTVISSIMEHHSNIVPWQLIKRYKDINIEYLLIDNNTNQLDLNQFEGILKKGNTKLVSVTHVSNVLGTVNPIKEIIDISHKYDVKVLIDAAQSVPHREIDVRKLDVDFLAFSSHKMLGPTGVGVLYAKKEILEEMTPFLGGGDMIEKVSMDETTFNEVPYKFEAGTPNIAGAIGLGAAIDYLQKIGMNEIQKHEEELTSYALDNMKKIEGIRIFGPLDATKRGGVISFCIKDIHPHDISQVLSDENIAIRAGHHCAMPLTKYLGEVASARASFYIYNTREDIDKLISALEKVKSIFS